MLSTTDYDVERLLKLFTFLPIKEIGHVMSRQWVDPSLRVAQHRLAYEFLCLAHGPAVAKETADLHKSRSAQRKSINVSQLLSQEHKEKISAEASLVISMSELESSFFSDLLHHAGLVETKGEGKRLVSSQGAYVGAPSEDGEVLEWQPISKDTNAARGLAVNYVVWDGDTGILLLRVGKWKVKSLTVSRQA
jgi:tyrosyl-tRNA synthetase